MAKKGMSFGKRVAFRLIDYRTDERFVEVIDEEMNAVLEACALIAHEYEVLHPRLAAKIAERIRKLKSDG